MSLEHLEARDRPDFTALAAELEAFRNRHLLETPGKERTPWAILSRCVEALRHAAGEPQSAGHV